MAPSIRPPLPSDIPAMVDLLLRDGAQRSTWDPTLWAVATDAPTRLAASLSVSFASPETSARELWLLAETAGRIVGLTHSMIVPVPPIYGIAAPPGLFLDDCFVLDVAPAGTAEALLLATQAALRDVGASSMIASCPAASAWRAVYERHDFEPVTLYLAKHGFSFRELTPGVRHAQAADVPGIVARSAEHRTTLAALNSRFWHIHPEADSRFAAWMGYSLTLTDRAMFVAGEPDNVQGYSIAQPIAPLLVPAAHDIKAVGVLDDFYSRDFASVASVSNGGQTAMALLAAAESAFARRAFTSALAVCPAAWTSKVSVLERAGYKTAKLWLLQR